MQDSKEETDESIKESYEDRANEQYNKILVTDEGEEQMKAENPTNKHHSMQETSRF